MNGQEHKSATSRQIQDDQAMYGSAEAPHQDRPINRGGFTLIELLVRH